MKHLSEFQQQAVLASLTRLFNEKNFSICTVDNLANLLGRSMFLGGDDYRAMRAMHCIEWGDMNPEVADMLRQKIIEILGLSDTIKICAKDQKTYLTTIES